MDVVYSNYRFIEPELAFEAKECAASDDIVLTKEYSGEGTISFHNISYVVEQTQLCFKKRPPKVILNNVSGIMKVGLHAIMGPTGSGKTSLLDVLADRKAKKGLSGHVLINGKRQPHNFKFTSAYVVQDDIVVGTLTVRENIMVSASLRLPASYTCEDLREKVNSVINQMGLRKVADSKVGTELLRGISGGEKKRLSIAMELIRSPTILFLDEPTTGQDSATAVSLVRLLKDLSVDGRVIVMVIHQPRYCIFKLFDSLTLLSNGQMVYHGPAANALDYFARIGYVYEQHNNPADFFLNMITANENSVKNGLNEISSLTYIFKKSYEHEEIQIVLQPLLNKAFSEARGTASQYNTDFTQQLLVLAKRTILNIIRDPLLGLIQIVIMGLLAGLIGIIFFQVDDSFVGVQDRMGVLFFIIMNLVFGNLPSIDLFIKEKAIFKHENISGYYRVSVYFIINITCEMLLLRILPTMVFAIISYWIIGLRPEASSFFIYLLTLILTTIAASSIAFLFSAMMNGFAVATSLTTFSFVIMSAFAGFLINVNSIGDWLSWLQYISIFRYSLHALAENELSGKVYCDKLHMFDNVSNVTMYQCIEGRTINGTTYLDDQQLNQTTIVINLLALLIITSINLIGTYVALRVMKKEK